MSKILIGRHKNQQLYSSESWSRSHLNHLYTSSYEKVITKILTGVLKWYSFNQMSKVVYWVFGINLWLLFFFLLIGIVELWSLIDYYGCWYKY